MEHISKIIDNILTEWAYNVNDGMPDVNNPLHMAQLEHSLYDLEFPEPFIVEFIQNLRERGETGLSDEEREKAKKKGLKHLGRGSWGKKEGVPTHKTQDGKLVPIDNEEPEEKKDRLDADDFKSSYEKDKSGEKDSAEVHTKATDIYKDDEVGQLKQSGDHEIKQSGLNHGYKKVKDKNGNVIFQPAPGNAGSMWNEIISGEVANILEQNPNLSDDELVELIINQFGETELAKQNKNKKQTAAGVSIKSIPEGQDRGLYSKTLLAVKSGKRKHKKAQNSANKNNFKNPEIRNYYGHSESFDAMVNDIQGKQIIGPNGKPLTIEEAEDIIRSGGGGDNPSDTATFIFDSDSDKVIMLFHSDKDSLDAIVAQSSAKAEAEANEENIDKLVENGHITQEQAEALKGQNIELVEQLNEIENELKQVSGEPGKFFVEKVDVSEALESAKNNIGPDGVKDKNPTHKHLTPSLMSRGKPHPSIKKYLKTENPTEEELLSAFFEYMADPDKETEPTETQMKLMERLNRRWASKGAPDVDPKIEEIRKRTIETEVDYIKQMDVIRIDIGDGKQVGVGTFLEANTIYKQFHLEAINSESEKGVHKYPGMLETNHAGLAVDGEVLSKCLGGVKNRNGFIQNFEVGESHEQLGVSGTQKGRVTGSKRIVYAITSEGERIEIGVKVARSKTGKLGKLQTVYQWSDDMKKCFDKDGKR